MNSGKMVKRTKISLLPDYERKEGEGRGTTLQESRKVNKYQKAYLDHLQGRGNMRRTNLKTAGTESNLTKIPYFMIRNEIKLN